MRKLFFRSLLLACLLFACVFGQVTNETGVTPAPTGTPVPTVLPSSSTLVVVPIFPEEVSWQIQYTEEIDIDLDVDMFNLDLFDTPNSLIQELHQRGIFVLCYFSAGSYEDWRPDREQFPAEVLGQDMAGWPGEKWLDIRRLDLLAPIMEARLDLAVQKGCDGVDPDNVNGYENDTGLPLTYEDQLIYNRYLATESHERGMAVGLKNDLAQIPDLVAYFDWIINESCFTFDECHLPQNIGSSQKF